MAIQPIRENFGRLLVALFFLLPFLKIGGESAFRFDVPTLRLHVFGVELWMQEFILVLLATLFLVALFLLLTFVFGRAWCGWACPQTLFSDLTSFMDHSAHSSPMAAFASHILLLLFSFLAGFISVCYVLSPYEAIPALLEGRIGPVASGSTIVIGLITYVNFAFVRRTFCATICPYAKIQGALTDDRSLLIQLDPHRSEECIDCRMCVRKCPTDLDIREGMQVGCIMCARCIDACAKVMGKQRKKGLVNYSFGGAGISSRSELIRPASIILSLICLFTLTLFVYKSVVRASFDFSILPHRMEARMNKAGDVQNAYVLSIQNKRREEIALTFDLQAEEGVSTPLSNSITTQLLVGGGLVEKFPLFVRAKGTPEDDFTMQITLTADGEVVESRTRSVYFTVPHQEGRL